jgi:hypothetical protein
LADQYGQFTRADWPGKIHQDADFQTQDTDEQQWLAAHPKPPDRDLYGAWRDGPQLTNNGFFRTAFVLNGQEVSPGSAPANQGRWWLVAPSGRFFFSLGVDVIDYGETTRVAGRESLFDWLPGPGDALQQFSPLQECSGVFSLGIIALGSLIYERAAAIALSNPRQKPVFPYGEGRSPAN